MFLACFCTHQYSIFKASCHFSIDNFSRTKRVMCELDTNIYDTETTRTKGVVVYNMWRCETNVQSNFANDRIAAAHPPTLAQSPYFPMDRGSIYRKNVRIPLIVVGTNSAAWVLASLNRFACFHCRKQTKIILFLQQKLLVTLLPLQCRCIRPQLYVR